MKNTLRLGSIILAIGYAGLLAASVAMVARGADPTSAIGRHLWAGALANTSRFVVEILVITQALRRGEKWAWWAAALPMVGYGIPILILDATHVPPERFSQTLAPQVVGLAVAGVGLTLTARDIGCVGRHRRIEIILGENGWTSHFDFCCSHF